MQRLIRNPRLLSLGCFQSNRVRRLCFNSPELGPLSGLPSFFDAKRFWEISALAKTLPIILFKRHFSVTWRRIPLSRFFKRTEAVEKVHKLLVESRWDEDTPAALTRLKVRICVYVASEVLRFPIEVNTAVSFFNWLKSKDGFEPDSYVYNAIIKCVGKAGRFDEMEAMAAECESEGKATLATFTCIIAIYTMARNLEEALRTWRHMEEIGFRPSTITYTTMIDLYGKMKMYSAAADLYLEMVRGKTIPNVRTCTVLVRHLVEAGKLEAAVTIFHEMVAVRVKPNAVTYQVLMSGYAKAGDLDAVLNLAREFKDRGHRPHLLGRTFSSVLKFLLTKGRIEDAERIIMEMWPEYSPDERREKLTKVAESDVSNWNSCGPVDSMAANSNVDSDDEIDDHSSDIQPREYPRSMWNIAAFVRALVPWRAGTAECLQHAKVKWDGYLVLETLKRLRKPAVAWKFFEWVRTQREFSHDIFTYARMIQIFLGAGNFSRVKQLLLEVQEEGLTLPLHVYNKIIQYCGKNREADVALEVFDLLQKVELKPDESTYKYLIIALYKCNRYWRAATTFSAMQRAGLYPNVEIYALVMGGFGRAGNLKMVMALYKRMRASHIEPNQHVYGACISAFCKNGNSALAIRLFQLMRKDGITPLRETYNLMIEVFKREGKLDTVQKLEDESKGFVTKLSGRKSDLMKFLSFRTIFIQSLTDNDMSQSVAVG